MGHGGLELSLSLALQPWPFSLPLQWASGPWQRGQRRLLQPPPPWLQEEAEITVESLELRFALFEQRSALEMLDG
jgi:hypothetical protein